MSPYAPIILAVELDRTTVPSAALLIVGIVFISAWLLMRSRRRHIKGPGHTTAREQLERYKQEDGLRNDLESLMVEIEQLAKRVGSQLDAKAMRVERLIDDADLRIAQLQKAMQEQHNGSGQPPTATPDPTPPPPPAAPPTPETSVDPLTAEIYKLADQGQAPVEIAKQLDEHTGKVELILALRQV